jgi:hypothetical protein
MEPNNEKIQVVLKSHHYILVGFAIAALAIVSVWVNPPSISSDSSTYLESMQVLKTGHIPQDFKANRIVTTYLGMESILALSSITGNVFSAWIVFDITVFTLGLLAIYAMFSEYFEDKKIAATGTVLVAASYAAVPNALNFVMDSGGWMFFLFGFFCAWRLLKSGNARYLWAGALAAGIGSLFKEYGLLGAIPVYGCAFYLWREKRLGFKQIFFSGLAAAIPMLGLYSYVLVKFNYSYLNWFASNRSSYASAIPSLAHRIDLYVKVLGSLYTFGWFLFLGGVWRLLREKAKFVSRQELYFIFLALLAGLPAFAWPYPNQRIFFVLVPFLAMVSCFYLKENPRAYRWAVPILLLYVIAGYTMDAYILPNLNIDSVFRIITG